MTGRQRDGGRLFALVAGLLAGVLVTAVVAPKRQPSQVTAVAPAEAADAFAAADGAAGSSAPGADAGATAPADSVGGDTPQAGGTPAGAGGDSGVGAGDVPAPSGGGTPATAGLGPATAPAGVRGVTNESIKIGVAYPDLSALKVLGPAYDNGDVEKQWRALYDRWKREGVVPVHGRDIQLVFRKYQVLSPAEQRAACIGLVQDERVFAVVGQTYFAVGSECVARELRTPLLTSDGPTEAVFARSHPFLFSLQMSEDRVLRNLIHWAHARGALKGKEIGIYYEDRADVRELMAKTVKAELGRLGYSVAAEATTTQTLGGPQDAVAVQRFRTAGVDVALLFTSKGGFMQQAEVQAYRPTYLESDYLFGTSDTATSTYPEAQFDGALALTGRRVGETPVGIPLGPEGEACVSNYERFSGEKLEEETTVWAYVLTVCDLGASLMAALNAAGSGLTPQSLVAGFETMRNVSMTRYAPVTFTPEKHHGVDTHRTLRWAASCKCWKASGPFKPLFVT